MLFVGVGIVMLMWIKIGYVISGEIEMFVNMLKVLDIMDLVIIDLNDVSYMKIYFGGKFNWMCVKLGMEKVVVFFEMYCYVVLFGGSMVFMKFEGMIVNVKDKIVYMVMLWIEMLMVKGNVVLCDVVVDKKIVVGVVYVLNLKVG